ncbi:2-phosphosulfolactate phosphatase family protein [Fulvivirga kasyanovii]|uniref:Probable 2-phosphosulfolactate phosphatase n=1 Tax=Fulvivirga kasyanovii TaxID=396812 RepID=A0ABW9RZ80_9BACT|nr:2-phosphosulfolactate phosphatase [Fulvivirga kasyanovii]MTI28639.1 2-phosphosulfolactate phosphatase [Fulvivirga kasyanovii]
MKTIDVCLSPDLIHLFDVKNKVVVVVDILRATSCMTTGMAYGVKSIKPFSSLEECRQMKSHGYYIAGERNGEKVEDFDLGNSPFDYMNPDLKGKSVAVTTTNGTVAIEKSQEADEIVIGAFLNISAVAQYLREQEKDVLIFCAGWKGKVNMEDSLFAGALIEKLQNDFANECDAPLIVQAAYQDMSHNLLALVQSSSHAKRLQRLNIYEDIEYCLKLDEYDVVPVIRNGEIVLLKEPSVS